VQFLHNRLSKGMALPAMEKDKNNNRDKKDIENGERSCG
jgi:hypothetical protein